VRLVLISELPPITTTVCPLALGGGDSGCGGHDSSRWPVSRPVTMPPGLGYGTAQPFAPLWARVAERPWFMAMPPRLAGWRR